MITKKERDEIIAGHGRLRDEPGWLEACVADLQVATLMCQMIAEMNERGISQADLGRAMGVHRRQILRWVSSEPSLKAETMIAMGRHVGLRLEARWVPVEADIPVAAPYAGVKIDANSAGLDMAA